MTPEKIQCGDFEIAISSIPDIAIHGKHSLVFSGGEQYYELKPIKDDNAMKFLLLFADYKKAKHTVR